MKKRNAFILCLLVLGAAFVFAHTPLLVCYENGDGTSAKGVEIRVVDSTNKVLIKGKLDKNSEYTFKKPKGSFIVIFDAGPGHVVKVKSEDIK